MDWSIDLKLNVINREQGREYKKAMTKATAKRYWLLCDPSGEITAQYFQMVRDTLVLVSQSKVLTDFGQYKINKMMNQSLEMIWTT